MTSHDDPFSKTTINSQLDGVTGACGCSPTPPACNAPVPDLLDRRGWPFAPQPQQPQQPQHFNFQQWWPQFQKFLRTRR